MISRSNAYDDKVLLPIIRCLANLMNKAKDTQKR